MFEVFCLYLVLKNIYMRILIVLVSFMLFSCTENVKKVDNSNQKQKEQFQYTLRSFNIGVYPSFQKPIEVLIDFDDKYFCVYSPQLYVDPNDKTVEAFMTTIEDADLLKIDTLIKSFSHEDFKNPNYEEVYTDGLNLEALFVFSNYPLQKVSTTNNFKEKYKDLYEMILDVVLKYNKSKSNKKLIEEIIEVY